MRGEPIYFDSCFEIRPLVKKYVFGRLDAEYHTKVEAHLAECQGCMDDSHVYRSDRLLAQAHGEDLLEQLFRENREDL